METLLQGRTQLIIKLYFNHRNRLKTDQLDGFLESNQRLMSVHRRMKSPLVGKKVILKVICLKIASQLIFEILFSFCTF